MSARPAEARAPNSQLERARRWFAELDDRPVTPMEIAQQLEIGGDHARARACDIGNALAEEGLAARGKSIYGVVYRPLRQGSAA